MSLAMTAVRAVLSHQNNVLRTPESIQSALDRVRTPAPVTRRLRRRCHVEESVVGGLPVTTLIPRQAASAAEIIYLHGGAYVNPVVGAHWSIIDALIARTGATVTVPMYGLAPEHTVAEAIPFLEEVLSEVEARRHDRPVYFAGDSAGGGLALALSLHLRDHQGVTPAGLFLFSPWLDASMSNAAAGALVPYDVMLDIPGLAWCGTQWAGPLEVRHPYVSPIHADLSGLPPVFVYQGGRDIFMPDAIAFTEKSRLAGTDTHLELYPDGFHVFMGATFTPEARAVFNDVAQVVSRNRSAQSQS